ncbi:ABC transporter permease [Guyparkeria sp.]|uniref:ABC transporter permease n=1 Tax=Guyparkeria sp. TaxID=2035736 RepID=UPI003970DC6A
MPRNVLGIGSSPRLARPALLVFVAWRNLWRNPVRSLLTVSALAGALVMVILYAALLEGMLTQMVSSATERTTGHLQVHRQAFIDDRDLYATLPGSHLEAIEALDEGMAVTPRLYAAGLASADQTSTGVMIQAIDPDREPRVTDMLSHVREGRARLQREGPGHAHPVVIGSQLARNMRIAPGSELVLVTQAADGSVGNAIFRVTGVLKPIAPDFDRMGVLLSIDAYRELMSLEDGFHELAVHLDDPDDIATTQVRLDQVLADLASAQPLDELGGPAVVRNWRELNPTLADMLALSETLLLVIGLIVISLAAMGVLNTMLMAVHERSHEFGILLAIGMKRRWLLTMVMFESLFLGLVAAVLGVTAGMLLVAYLGEDGIDFSAALPEGYDWAGMVFEPVIPLALEAGHVIEAVLLMLGITLFAAAIPSWHSTRLKPAEVMR